MPLSDRSCVVKVEKSVAIDHTGYVVSSTNDHLDERERIWSCFGNSGGKATRKTLRAVQVSLDVINAYTEARTGTRFDRAICTGAIDCIGE